MSQYPAIISRGTYEHDIPSLSQLVSAPGPYLEFGEFLYLEASSTDASCTLRFSGKFLSTDNEIRAFSEDMVITGTGNQTAVTSRIGPCWLMGFSVRAVTGTVTDGEVVASVHVARAGASTPVHVMTLASGEVTNTRALGLYGYTAQHAPAASSTWEYVYNTVTNPAAGAAAVWNAPAGYESQVMTVECNYVASIAVANRVPTVTYVFAGGGYQYNYASQVIAASGSEYLTWNPGADAAIDLAPVVVTPIDGGVSLHNGDSVRVTALNIQAADQVSNVYVSYRRRAV